MTIELQGSVWMTVGGAHLGGEARIALLLKIAECGSITQAAKSIKMSYKAAWDAIDQMNNLAGEPLVERVSGGKGGGGTRLTQRGAALVANFRRIVQEHRHFVEQLGQMAGEFGEDFRLIRRMALKTSARNQFFGKVSRLQPGAVNDEVELEVAGGHKIIAIITHDSTRELGLAPGTEAFALVKASSIILANPIEGAKFSARNQLFGRVTRLIPGAVNCEVVLELDGNASIAAVITNQSCSDLGLAPGQPAMALFKASSVILATPA